MALIAGKRVTVAGAGIAGTAFALALRQACVARGISPMPVIRIFEREASPTARENLGYAFSLMQDGKTGPGGLQVVRQLKGGILEELERLQEPGNTSHICWKSFKPLVKVDKKPEEGTRTILRIMRARLRQTLLSRVPQELVEYGKVCVSAEPAAEAGQPLQLTFQDGSTTEADLLVVADGANSKLRRALLPGEVNRYAGVCMLFGRTKRLQQLPPELQRGHYISLGKHSTALFCGSVDKNTVLWSLSSKVPRSRVDELNNLFKDPPSAQKFLDLEVPKLAEGFTEPLPSLLRNTPASALIAYPTMDKPPHPIHGNGIVYLGDAWHPMSPFAGAGANMALQDAWELAQQLVNGGHSCTQAAISQYAVEAAPRSAEAIERSRRVIAVAHTNGWRKMLLVTGLRVVGIMSRLTNWNPFTKRRGGQSASSAAMR